MSLALGAIERAAQGGAANQVDRNKVIDELFATENRESVLGTYSIDDNGDTTITDYGAYEVKGGELTFRDVIKAEAPTPPKTGGPAGGEKPPVSNNVARAKGGRLTIYSSLPAQGAARIQTIAVQNGMKLALQTANNKAGPFTIEYKPLDDSTAQAGSWDPGQTGQNARRVVGDDSAVFYLGEFNSGASVISMPILNKAGVPQISPANTAVGLTSDEPGADRGEPGKYYSNKRHYARVSPKDTIQGAALATLMQQEGCTKVFIANDKEVYGAGLGRNIELAMENL
jgi:ABC-type branched-subunit amino acid transport system substrate-binding protein